MKSREEYTSPDMEIRVFEIEDIITTSDIDEGEVDITNLNI